MHLNYSTICGVATCHELVKRKKSGLEVVNPDKFVRINSGKQDLIATAIWLPVNHLLDVVFRLSFRYPLKIPFAILARAAPFQTGFILERGDNTLRLPLFYPYQVS